MDFKALTGNSVNLVDTNKWRLRTLRLPRFWQLHLASLLAILRIDTELRTLTRPSKKTELLALAHRPPVRIRPYMYKSHQTSFTHCCAPRADKLIKRNHGCQAQFPGMPYDPCHSFVFSGKFLFSFLKQRNGKPEEKSAQSIERLRD
jgi:hypothetical protein